MAVGEVDTVGVFTTDRGLVVQTWSSWLAHATGRAESEVIGHPLVELYPELIGSGFERRLRRVIDDGAVEVLAAAFHSYLIPCSPRTSSPHFARMQQHVTIAPLRDDESIHGVVVTIEDVTSRLDRERDLAAALASDDESIRQLAEEVLASDDEATTTLAGALGDHRWSVRGMAAERLSQGGADSVAALITAVRERHSDAGALNAALTGLVNSEHDVVPSLLELLQETEADLRTYAALALGLVRDQRAVPHLLAALDDDDTNVRQHAVEALGRIGSDRAAEALCLLAETRDFYLAFGALDALAEIGDPSIAPRLLPLLDDELIGAPAAEALGKLGGAEAIAPIAALLSRADVEVEAVARALASLVTRLGSDTDGGEAVAGRLRSAITPEGARRLLVAFDRSADDVIPALSRVASWLDIDGMETHLVRLLSRSAPRQQVAEVLLRRGERAVDPLLEALTHVDPEVRKCAAATLGRIGKSQAVPGLTSALGDEPSVSIAAAEALASIGDSRAAEPLLEAFDHDDAAVRQAAAAAINSIGPPKPLDWLHASLMHPSPRIRESAARVAGYVGDAHSLEPMLELARDQDEVVRRVAVEHLVYFDDPRATRTVADATGGDPRPSVRAAGARAMAYAQGEIAVAALLPALGDEDPWVRYHAARAVGHQRLAVAIPRLGELARDDVVPPVRIASIEALTEIGAGDAASIVARLVDDANPEVAAAARQAVLTFAGEPQQGAGDQLRTKPTLDNTLES